MIKILSIDGGGIRGIIPAMVLDQIEQKTGKRISELFHLIAGTSTGGILALGLTRKDGKGKAKFRASDLVGLYESEGKTIFPHTFWQKISTLGGLAGEKYPSEGIEGVLNEFFGESRLSEALTNLLVTSYEIERRDPFLFKSTRAKKDPDYNYLMRDVARATSAAPTYFEPAKIQSMKQRAAGGGLDYYALIDGGVFANNPAMCAFVEARTNNTINPANINDFLLVSLGTGQLTRRIPYDEAKDWGLAMWARPILNVVFDGVCDTVDYELKQLLPNDRYYRFQISLEAMGKDDMDDASGTNLHALRSLADDMMAKNKSSIDALCGQLLSN
jgi:patatin-like phospholipase/acyl hydrolase